MPVSGQSKCHTTGDTYSLHERMAEPDGIIFATPVYFYGMTAHSKALIDRTCAPLGPGRSLADKVSGIIAIAGSVGLMDVVKGLYFYFAVKPMLGDNWLGADTLANGDIKEKQGVIETAGQLGKEKAQLVGKQFEYPSGFRRSYFAYKTHTD